MNADSPSSFVSRTNVLTQPLGNARTDAQGGSQRNRMRFPLEVFDAVRAAWPSKKPLGVRFNGTDWLPSGLQGDDAVAFARELKARGCDYMDLSSGGSARAEIPLAPGCQVPYASQVRREVDVPTMCVGLIRDPLHAQAIVANGDADLVALGRPRSQQAERSALGLARRRGIRREDAGATPIHARRNTGRTAVSGHDYPHDLNDALRLFFNDPE